MAIGDPSQGLVYIYARSGTTWVQEATLTGSRSFFGRKLALDGDSLAVLTNTDEGAVTIFTRSRSRWTEQQTFPIHPESIGRSVFSIALDNDTLVVGNTGTATDGLTEAGSA